MSDFTIEQLEALKEGTTPGPWEAKPSPGAGVKGQREPDDVGTGPALIAGMQMPWRAERHDANAQLMATAPALVDALIAEKQAHAELARTIIHQDGEITDLFQEVDDHHHDLLRVMEERNQQAEQIKRLQAAVEYALYYNVESTSDLLQDGIITPGDMEVTSRD